MQSPTPPTKPTPPIPPSMATSTVVPSTDTHTPATTTPQFVNPSKAPPASKEQSTAIPNPVPESTNNILPPAFVSTTNNTSTETTSEKLIPATTQLAKNNSSATGFSAFFVLICTIAIALVAIHWWKNYQPKQRSTVDYSTESSDEIVNLILSQTTLESATQAPPKKIAKKIIKQTDSTPKTKVPFEVRV